MLECVPCTPAHIEDLKPRMREADRVELHLATGLAPECVLDEALRCSTQSFAWIEGGVVLCVFGVAPHPHNPDVGTPWLIGSDEAVAAGKRLVRHCIAKIEVLSKPYRMLYNIVHAENSVAIRWLKWCGFEFLQPIEVGPHRASFLPFIRQV